MSMIFYAAILPSSLSTRYVLGIGDTPTRARLDARAQGALAPETLIIEPITLDQAKRIANGETRWPL
jgi:hypothetical protein